MTPIPDRRQQPRIPGMIATQPAPLDDDDSPLHILPYADADIDRAALASGANQAGNIWFAGPEPDDTDRVDWWPVTGRQIIAFWVLVVALALLVASISVTAAGLAHGFTPADIVSIVLAGGHA